MILVDTSARIEWLTREVGEDKAGQVIAFTKVCHVVPLDNEDALATVETCRKYKLATAADAVIVQPHAQIALNCSPAMGISKGCPA